MLHRPTLGLSTLPAEVDHRALHGMWTTSRSMLVLMKIKWNPPGFWPFTGRGLDDETLWLPKSWTSAALSLGKGPRGPSQFVILHTIHDVVRSRVTEIQQLLDQGPRPASRSMVPLTAHHRGPS
uniref:Uncharacterized protein n=1 Tax=Solanum tuberosum TaxID=4113 RepID=M1DR92_SOLTU